MDRPPSAVRGPVGAGIMPPSRAWAALGLTIPPHVLLQATEVIQ
jgi:hypothetical protein